MGKKQTTQASTAEHATSNQNARELAILAAAFLLFAAPSVHGFISTADARVGRPLTPVSVAGVPRRSARRCAAGVTC
jgi:hypothetical protein